MPKSRASVALPRIRVYLPPISPCSPSRGSPFCSSPAGRTRLLSILFETSQGGNLGEPSGRRRLRGRRRQFSVFQRAPDLFGNLVHLVDGERRWIRCHKVTKIVGPELIRLAVALWRAFSFNKECLGIWLNPFINVRDASIPAHRESLVMSTGPRPPCARTSLRHTDPTQVQASATVHIRKW